MASIITDLFSGIGDFQSAAGQQSAAQLFTQAATVGTQEEAIEKASGAIQEAAATRQIYGAVGQNVAAAGGNGEATAGSAANVVRSTVQQGAIQRQLLNTQSAINVEGTQLQVISAQGQAAQAEATANAQQTAGAGSLLGGLFGLGSLLFSDRRLKRDIKFFGWYKGFPVYCYRFLWSRRWRFGVMAQDVLEIEPELVKRHWSGFFMVDYGKLIHAPA